MGKSVRVFSVVAISVASVFVGLSTPAGANSAARVVAHRHASAAAVPNSNLSGKAATAKFTPKKLTAITYKNEAACSVATPPTSLTVTNATKNKYKVTFNGSVAFTLPKNTIESLCVYGPPGTITLGIKGSTHTLVVKLVKPTK